MFCLSGIIKKRGGHNLTYESVLDLIINCTVQVIILGLPGRDRNKQLYWKLSGYAQKDGLEEEISQL